MHSPMIRATWQAAVLGAISNVMGQAITCYQSNRPFTLNTIDLFHFTLFAILSCPPNFLWQNWLESRFPAHIDSSEGSAKQPIGGIESDRRGSHDLPDGRKRKNSTSQISFRNTAIKFALDQTIGAAVNTVLFIGGLALLRGEQSDVVMSDCREKFWPLILAGQKLWPAVSLMSFLMVPVEFRTTFGSIIGLVWGVYLSLISSSERS